MKKYRCTNCHELFTVEQEIKDKERQLCPYCLVVKFGDPDEEWLPSVKRDELDKRGFHKI